MINTHLHILLDIEEEPKTTEESVALARALVQEGIHVSIATHHYNDIFPQRPPAKITERVNALQQVLDCTGILLYLLTGYEALIKPGLVDDIQAGRLATVKGLQQATDLLGQAILNLLIGINSTTIVNHELFNLKPLWYH